jgi:hypothetical protein
VQRYAGSNRLTKLSIENSEEPEFRSAPIPDWLFCFSDTIQGPIQRMLFAVVLPNGKIVEPKVTTVTNTTGATVCAPRWRSTIGRIAAPAHRVKDPVRICVTDDCDYRKRYSSSQISSNSYQSGGARTRRFTS